MENRAVATRTLWLWTGVGRWWSKILCPVGEQWPVSNEDPMGGQVDLGDIQQPLAGVTQAPDFTLWRWPPRRRPPLLGLGCGWSPLVEAACAVPSEEASSPVGGPPAAGTPHGPPSSRLLRGPFFVDCILICWGLEFMGELLVVWRSCGGQVGSMKSELLAQV